MRRAPGPLSQRDRDTIRATGAALQAANLAVQPAFEQLRAAGVVITPTLRQIGKTAAMVEAFDRQPRHRDLPHRDDVIGWLDRHVGEPQAQQVTGLWRRRRVDDRDHAGLSLPCEVCDGPCIVDERGPTQWLVDQVRAAADGQPGAGTWPVSEDHARAGAGGLYRYGDGFHWQGGVGG